MSEASTIPQTLVTGIIMYNKNVFYKKLRKWKNYLQFVAQTRAMRE